MPFYDLRCSECGGEFNISASMTDKIEKRIPCPECGSLDLQTIYKAAPGVLKGTKELECPNSHICGVGCRNVG